MKKIEIWNRKELFSLSKEDLLKYCNELWKAYKLASTIRELNELSD